MNGPRQAGNDSYADAALLGAGRSRLGPYIQLRPARTWLAECDAPQAMSPPTVAGRYRYGRHVMSHTLTRRYSAQPPLSRRPAAYSKLSIIFLSSRRHLPTAPTGRQCVWN